MRRALNVIENGGNPQITSLTGHPYDHPYFGWLFLAGLLSAVGYPYSLQPSSEGDIESIEKLYLVPRLIVGVLAIVDTFLIYKIAERRYHSRDIAVTASILFSVTPLTWLIRGVFLDTILLPLLLASILFALHLENPMRDNYIRNGNYNNNRINLSVRNISVIVFSGILLGLAIFTKIPIFTMIPLVGFLIYTNSNRNLKALGIWLIPVLLIPAIWPAHAMYSGDLDMWKDDILWQATERPSQSLFYSIEYFFKTDPILFILGLVGMIYAATNKNIMILLWAIPFLIFLYLIGYVAFFHLNPLLPLLCVAAAVMVVELSRKIISAKNFRQRVLVSSGIIVAIAISQLITTITLVIVDENSLHLKTVAFLSSIIPGNTQIMADPATKLTIVGPSKYFWTAQSVFDKDMNDYTAHGSIGNVRTDRAILVVDGAMVEVMEKQTKSGGYLRSLYNNSELVTRIQGEYGRDQYGQLEIRMANSNRSQN